jgi:hypothetical protein
VGDGGSYAGPIAAPTASRALGLVALIGLAAFVVAGVGGCDELVRRDPEVVVRLEAPRELIEPRLVPEFRDLAGSWGATRVGESTDESGDASLTFSLPAARVDQALTAIRQVGSTDGVRIVSTAVDLEPTRVDAAPEPDGTGPAAADVELRIDMSSGGPEAGTGVMVRFVMALFSVVGMLATPYLLWLWWTGRTRRPADDATDSSPPPRGTDWVGDDSITTDWIAADPPGFPAPPTAGSPNRPRLAPTPRRRIRGWHGVPEADADPPTRETPVVGGSDGGSSHDRASPPS